MTKEEKLYNKIDTLNSILWDNRALRPLIEDWLKNFKAEERDSALYLLSRCMFFWEFMYQADSTFTLQRQVSSSIDTGNQKSA